MRLRVEPTVAQTAVAILAGGRATRMGALAATVPKCLLEVGGRPILAWMLDALHAAGVRRAGIVVGHCADQVAALTASPPPGMTIERVHNPDYQKGSALSLLCARRLFASNPTLIMDADVVFPRAFLQRLMGSPAPNALLIDRGFSDTGEEVKLYAVGDRVIALGKKVVPRAWDVIGEGVGFFKCSAGHAPEYIRLLEESIRETGGANEYEDALHRLLAQVPVGWVDVTGLPWTEVDFAEDLRRAEMQVLPEIERLGP